MNNQIPIPSPAAVESEAAADEAATTTEKIPFPKNL